MSENQFHYGTNFTSVKTHHAPGGTSSISLGWDPEEPKAPAPRKTNEELKAEEEEEKSDEEGKDAQ